MIYFTKLDICFFNLFLILLNCYWSYGFNIETVKYAVYGTSQNSMFGFTVAVHKESYNKRWVLVGAPNAQSDRQQIERGGAVYKCSTIPPTGNPTCEEVPFDLEGNQYIRNKQLDNKSFQWFGASLSTSGNPSGGPIVACAPRYVWFSKEMNRRDPVGTCFVADSHFEKFEEYSPCRTSNWGYNRQGSCQAGFSAAVNSNGDRLFVGAPGSYYWQGQMYSIDAHATFNYTPGLLGTTYGAKGSVHQQSLETRPAVFQTRESSQQDDNSYLGYSTIVGDFLGNGEQGIAVGMPRGSKLYGKVVLFTWNLTSYKNISGAQLGSYFGYSLAAVDVDGDKKLDLIIGAPLHTEPNTLDQYDVGRVYVFYQGGSHDSFNKSSFIDGMNSKSRFGHSVAALGDLNKDGYGDFAVGAPYDGENNNGVVYIFYGSDKGVLSNYGQVIKAEQVQTPYGRPVSTFGFSVAGGLDMDGNDYPDLAVGAYLSNTAFFFRSRPVVRVDASVNFLTQNKQIDIKNRNCTIGGSRVACTQIKFCVKYSGEGIPQNIRLDVEYILDSKKPANLARMKFPESRSYNLNRTLYLAKDNVDICQTEDIYIENDIRDKLTQLEAEVKYSMIQNDPPRQRDPRSELSPVLDLNLPPSRKASIIIQNNCGHDNICIPDLHINVTKNIEKYLLDSKTPLKFDIIVSNLGEDAFETTFDIIYPEGIHYQKIGQISGSHHIDCTIGDNRTITCDIGNPLAANNIVVFQLVFEPYQKEIMPSTYVFQMKVNSTNPENQETIADNFVNVTIDVWVDSALEIVGASIPSEIQLGNNTNYNNLMNETLKEADIGPQVIHLYTLSNKGPATINQAEVYVLWPWKTLADEDLLYLLEPPNVPEGVTCEPVLKGYINHRSILLDLNRKPISETIRADSANSYSTQITKTSATVQSGANITGIIGGEAIKPQTDEQHIQTEGRVNVEQKNSGLTVTGEVKPGFSSYTKTEWITVKINGQPVTKQTNVTIIKDGSGKIVNTIYSSDDENRMEHAGQKNIVYSSSGNSKNTEQGGDLSISKSHSATLTSGKQIFEHPAHEEFVYATGGGSREGGNNKSLSNENQATKQENVVHENQQQNYHYGNQHQFGSYSSESNHDEARRSEEENRRIEDPRRTKNENRRIKEARRAEEQNRLIEETRRNQAAHRIEETRITEEQNRRTEEARRAEEKNRVIEEARRNHGARRIEEARRAEEQNRLIEEARRNHGARRIEEENRRIEEARRTEEQNRRIEEARRIKSRPEETGTIAGGSRQQHEAAWLIQQRERQRLEEEKYRQQAEYDHRRHQEEEARRRDWELQIRRNLAEHERRERERYSANRVNLTSQSRASGSRSSHGDRVRTGYFSADGKYHDETNLNRGIENSTWTSSSDNVRKNPEQNLANHRINFGEVGTSDNGFRTQTINLGMIGNSNANVGSEQASAKGQWTGSGQQRIGDFSYEVESEVGDQRYYRSEDGRKKWDAGVDVNSRDNVPTTVHDRHRGKRQAELDPDISDLLKCTATKCFYLKCFVKVLKKNQFISIALRSRLNLRAVKQLSSTQAVKLSSMAVARITELPYIGVPKEQTLYSHEIFTEIPAGQQELPPQFVPLWIILLSAIVGTLILLLVIVLLYKCGFFKRKRPSAAPERQPLRTNGFHQGDEAL